MYFTRQIDFTRKSDPNIPKETKEYEASFYENLYEAREGTMEYEQWNEHISKTVKEIENNIETMTRRTWIDNHGNPQTTKKPKKKGNHLGQMEYQLKP